MGQFNYTTFMLILLMFLLSHYIKLDLFIDLNPCICVPAYQLLINVKDILLYCPLGFAQHAAQTPVIAKKKLQL